MQQVLALVQAAGVAADELLEVMGVEDVETRAAKGDGDNDEDDGPDFGHVDDYSDDNLTDGDGQSDPTAVHAAAKALPNATGSDDEKRKAANKLMGHYTKMKENPPAHVLKMAGKAGSRDDYRAEDFDEEGFRKTIGSKERNDLPDSAFAYIEPGGEKDSEGKTTPRSKRHFPIHDAPHVRNALARIAQGAEFGDEAKPAVLKAAKKFEVDVGADYAGGKRNAEDELEAFFQKRAPAPV
jgi:hypothetical protein